MKTINKKITFKKETNKKEKKIYKNIQERQI